ncbi:MAG: FecR family protein [Candidatus Cryptobacteroides sp.]
MERKTLINFMLCRTTPEEEQEVLDWLDASPENRKEMDALDELFNAAVINVSSVKEYHSRRRLLGSRMSRVMTAAAVLLVALAGGYIFGSLRVNKMASKLMAVSAPDGQVVTIMLPDSSNVWLAGGSTIEYPAVFTGRTRHVRLKGEAMFDVKSYKKMFVVNTFAGDVEVLGTRFDVVAEEETGEFSTALLRGKVRIVDSAAPGGGVTLNPGEMARLSGGKFVTERIEYNDDFLWTEKVLTLNPGPFEDIRGRLEKTYGVAINVDEGIEPIIRSRGKINTEDGLEHTLKIILTGTGNSFDVDYEKRQVYIH